MEKVGFKLKLLLCFLLGGMVGAYTIGEYYFIPKHNEHVGMEDSQKSYSYAVIYKLIKNHKYQEAADALKNQSESLIKDKELILALIKSSENVEKAKNNFEKAEERLKVPDVEVHVIGVSEGSYPDGVGHSHGYHPDSFIEIIIKENSNPIALIIESHEPVVWKFINEKNTIIEKVVFSSPHIRKIIGLDAQTTIEYERVGFYGYKKEFAYKKVEEYSLSKFGVSPASLQIVQKGTQFVIK